MRVPMWSLEVYGSDYKSALSDNFTTVGYPVSRSLALSIFWDTKVRVL